MTPTRKIYEVERITPRVLPFKCPNCNGYGTVKIEKVPCHSCKARGIVFVEQDVFDNPNY